MSCVSLNRPLACFLVAIATTAAACRPATPAAAPKGPETPVERPDDREPDPENRRPEDDDPSSAEEASTTPRAESIEKPKVPGEVVEAVPEPAPKEFPPEAVQRLLLLTSDGPLLLEAGIFLDGRPFPQAMAAVVEEVLTAADVDGDGRPTWDEATTDARFIYGGYGNAEINNEQERQNALRLYDVDSDGLVDEEEVPRFITRNSGGAQAFAFRSGELYAAPGETDDPAWRAIDRDEDGDLSAEEIAAAAVTLAMRDSDADGVVIPADLAGLSFDPNLGMPARTRRYRGFGPQAVHRLGELADWSLIGYALEEAYPAFPGVDPAEVYRTDPELFAAIDASGDLRLDPDEVARLNELTPHVQIEIRLGSEPVADKPADEPEVAGVEPKSSDEVEGAVGRVEPNEVAPEAEVAESEADAPLLEEEGEVVAEADLPDEEASVERLQLTYTAPALQSGPTQATLRQGVVMIRSGDFTIELFVNDAAAEYDPDAEAAATLAQFDGDANGYLDESELVDGAVAPFAGLDADADGQVVAAEIADYQRRRRTSVFSQVRVDAGARQGTLFAELDASGDGRLGARELAAATERLLRRDADADGRLQPHEAAAGYAVAFARGDPQQQRDLFVRRPQAPTGSTGPRWFAGMDSNRDGDVTRGEFPGDAETFARLDADGDGLVSVAEAEAAVSED